MARFTRPPDDTGGDAARRAAVAVYSTYREAERAVDYLSDNGFPVERTSIVGRDLKYVEQVTGRMTNGRAALNGAVAGAMVGFLVGWLFGVFDWFHPVVAAGWLALDGLWFGAIVGAVAGLIAHALTGGRRDFAGIPTMTADRYEVLVDADLVGEAARLIAQMDAPATASEAPAGGSTGGDSERESYSGSTRP
jgi:heat induced stress protein YflT